MFSNPDPPEPGSDRTLRSAGSLRSLSGRFGFLLLLLLTAVQFATITTHAGNAVGSYLFPDETPLSTISQICLMAAWIVVITAWYGDGAFQGWPTIVSASEGFILLSVFVFASGFPFVWIARFFPKVPYSPRAVAVALYPLLVHPLSVRKILDVCGRIRLIPCQRLILLGVLLLFPLICWVFRSVHISRDGYQCAEFVSQDIWYRQLREPLTILTHHVAASLLMKTMGVSAEQSLALFSCLLGVPALFFLFQTAHLSRTRDSTAYTPVLVTLFSAGFLLLWFGHVEVYPVLVAGMSLLLFVVSRHLILGKSIYWVSLVYGLLLPFHLSLGWLFPGMLYLFFRVLKREGLKRAGTAILIIGIVQVVVWDGICISYYEGSLQSMAQQFRNEMNVGLDKAMFVSWGDLLTLDHLAEVVQAFVYLSAPSVLGLIVLLLCRVNGKASTLETFLGLASLGYAVYLLTWRADRGYPEDWDLFSGIALPLGLYVGLRIERLEMPKKSRDVLVFLILVSTLPLLAYQFFVHTNLDTHAEYLRHLRQLRALGIIQ